MRDDADDPPIEEHIGDPLREADAMIATAESCTGGLIGSLITDVPGSSDYFDRTLAAYTYRAKRELLGVCREDLDDHGAVSEPVARQMARGIRDTAGVTWGVSTTGIAGPTGGTEEKPIGTVFIGVAYAGEVGTGESFASVERYEFDGTRTEIKEKIARQALTDALAAIEAQETE